MEKIITDIIKNRIIFCTFNLNETLKIVEVLKEKGIKSVRYSSTGKFYIENGKIRGNNLHLIPCVRFIYSLDRKMEKEIGITADRFLYSNNKEVFVKFRTSIFAASVEYKPIICFIVSKGTYYNNHYVIEIYEPNIEIYSELLKNLTELIITGIKDGSLRYEYDEIDGMYIKFPKASYIRRFVKVEELEEYPEIEIDKTEIIEEIRKLKEEIKSLIIEKTPSQYEREVLFETYKKIRSIEEEIRNIKSDVTELKELKKEVEKIKKIIEEKK